MTKKLFSAGLVVGLMAAVLGVRWAIVGRYSMDLPEWDQWDAEGLHLLLPWFQGHPMLPEFFLAHNEHYVVLTKLLNLSITLANGQWDQRLECVVNAFFPASIAIACLLWARRFTDHRFAVIFAFLLAFMWGLPLAWQNIIAGFHSQQFFLLSLSFAAIALLPFARSWSPLWFVGAACASLALLSMASGLFAAATVVGLLLLRWLLRETTVRAVLPAAVLSIALCVVAWLTRQEVYYHAALKAQSLGDFFLTIARSLQWPAPLSLWFGLLLWAPWALLIFRLLQRRAHHPAPVHGWILFGLGCWIWLQLIATGYARGAGGPAPAPRYLDTLVFGCTVNVLCLGWLGWQGSFGRFGRSAVAAVGVGWVAVFSWGIYRHSRQTLLVELPTLPDYHRKAIENTRAYLATGDISYLKPPDIPYPGGDSFAERLAHPELVRLLPSSVRPAVSLEPAPLSQGFLAHDGGPTDTAAAAATGLSPTIASRSFRRSWGSYGPDGLASVGDWTSAPLDPPATGGWLLFDLAGSPGGADLVMELRDATTQKTLEQIRPGRSAGEAWKSAAVPMPSKPFTVHAHDGSRTGWIAFSQPVPMPTLSYAAWRLTERGTTIAAAGLLLMSLCVVGSVLTSQSGPRLFSIHSFAPRVTSESPLQLPNDKK